MIQVASEIWCRSSNYIRNTKSGRLERQRVVRLACREQGTEMVDWTNMPGTQRDILRSRKGFHHRTQLILLTLYDFIVIFVLSFPIINITSGSAHEIGLTCNRDVSYIVRTQSILINYAESNATWFDTLSARLDGDLVQFLIRQVQVLGPNHTQTRPNPIHGYAQCAYATWKPRVLERQFHRIAVLVSCWCTINELVLWIKQSAHRNQMWTPSVILTLLMPDCLKLKTMKKMWEWLVCTRKYQSSSESIIKK